MKRLLLVLVLMAVMVLSSVPMPVSADKGTDLLASSIGVVQVVDNNIDVTYTGVHYRDAKGITQYQYTARISQAPIYNEDGTKVDCSWYLDSKIGAYSIRNNVFSATVTGSAISTTYQGETMGWNPVVLVDDREYTAKEPVVLAVDPINENYHNNTLEWDYGVCIRRVRVIEGLIQETWTFSENPRGTVWIKDNSTKSAGFTWAIAPYAYDSATPMPNSLVINQYKQVMASEFDRIEKEGEYPVIIDPTTQYLTSSSDGYLQSACNTWAIVQPATSASSAVGGNYFLVGEYICNILPNKYNIWRSFVYFDTSALPDSCTITASNLSLYGYVDSKDTDCNIYIQSGMPTYPHDPLVVGDFDKTYYDANGLGNVGFNTSGLITTGYNNISMNSTGWGWINKSSTTKLCIRDSFDVNNTSTTHQNEDIGFWSYEKGAGYRPYLEVTYTSSAAPTVVTYSPATSVTEISAVANGSVTDNGTNVITSYGICYGLFPNPDTTGTKNSTSADILGNFSKTLSPLVAGQTYYYRAFAINNVSTSYGAEYTFLTLPNASQVTTNPATYITPTQARLNGYLDSGGGETCQVRFQYAMWNGTAWVTNTSTANQSKVAGDSFIENLAGLTVNTQYTFRAESFNSYGQANGSWLVFNTSTSNASIGNPTAVCYSNSNSIDLSWVKDTNSSATYIRWKIGSYPTIYDGTLLPLQSGVGYTHTGLTPGTSYYYTFWGYDAGNTSATNSTTMCTTTAGGNVSATPVAPVMPGTWFSGTDTTKLQGLPFYQIVTDIGDAGHIPATTWWFMILLGAVMTGGLLVYSRSKNLFIACILVMVLLTVLSIMVLMPMWIVYAFAIASMGLSWKDLR